MLLLAKEKEKIIPVPKSQMIYFFLPSEETLYSKIPFSSYFESRYFFSSASSSKKSRKALPEI